jgi:pilus assembly protein CpaF
VTVLGADAGVQSGDALQLIGEALDLLVQIGIRHEVRRVTVISNVRKELVQGDIAFAPIFRYVEDSAAGSPQWQRVGTLQPRLPAEASL